MTVWHEPNETIYESSDGLRRATIFRSHSGLCVACEDNPNSKTERWDDTYGMNAGLTAKMAKEIAERFVAGMKIPKRLKWR